MEDVAFLASEQHGLITTAHAARAHEFADDYHLSADGLLTALAESTESTATTAEVALSILASNRTSARNSAPSWPPRSARSVLH